MDKETKPGRMGLQWAAQKTWRPVRLGWFQGFALDFAGRSFASSAVILGGLIQSVCRTGWIGKQRRDFGWEVDTG
jgi:hypothetical protein